jgi:hypothetical protein
MTALTRKDLDSWCGECRNNGSTMEAWGIGRGATHGEMMSAILGEKLAIARKHHAVAARLARGMTEKSDRTQRYRYS